MLVIALIPRFSLEVEVARSSSRRVHMLCKWEESRRRKLEESEDKSWALKVSSVFFIVAQGWNYVVFSVQQGKERKGPLTQESVDGYLPWERSFQLSHGNGMISLFLSFLISVLYPSLHISVHLL